MSSSSLSFTRLPARSSCTLPSNIASNKAQLNVRTAARAKSFFGTRLRSSGRSLGGGSERLHVWRSEGPGRSPELRVVVRSALSAVPEKPLGLYDPSMDKDSCGVGFVAELSGESSRKTVSSVWSYALLEQECDVALCFDGVLSFCLCR